MDDPRNEEFWKFKIATLTLGPDDVLVVSLPVGSSLRGYDLAREHLRSICGPAARILVKGDDITLTVASPKDTVRIKTGKVEIGRLIQRQHSMTGDASSHMIIDDPHDR